MATTLYPQSTSAYATTQRGTDQVKLNGNGDEWEAKQWLTTRGGGVDELQTKTVAGPTNGIEVNPGAGDVIAYEWITEPLAADVTISGTITANIWAREANMTDNVAINCVIDVIRAKTFGADGSNEIVQIVKSTRTTEVNQDASTNTANNFTTGMTSGYTPVAVNRGDRLRLRIFGDDAGTMGSGGTFTVAVAGTTGAANGDTFITFTENLTFETATPTGSTLYLTDTASDVSTASVDREAWTSRGGGVVNDVTNTVAGYTTPIQVTDTAGGTVVDWFTKQLQAVTLGGMAKANIRGSESAAAANTTYRLEIARVDTDGTNPTVWGSWCASPKDALDLSHEWSTTEAAGIAWISGDDLSISDGQRLRIRLYADETALAPMGASQTMTIYYNGTAANASGDSYVILPQTVAEKTSGSTYTKSGYATENRVA